MQLLAALGIVAVFLTVLSIIFMELWNFVAPTFGLPIITFWVSLAILMLISFLKAGIKK